MFEQRPNKGPQRVDPTTEYAKGTLVELAAKKLLNPDTTKLTHREVANRYPGAYFDGLDDPEPSVRQKLMY